MNAKPPNILEMIAADPNVSPRLATFAAKAAQSVSPLKPREDFTRIANYPEFLSFDDEHAERQSCAFAETHILGAITGLRLCKAQAATSWAMDILTDAITGLEDNLADIRGWKAAIEETASASRRAK